MAWIMSLPSSRRVHQHSPQQSALLLAHFSMLCQQDVDTADTVLLTVPFKERHQGCPYCKQQDSLCVASLLVSGRFPGVICC